MKLLSLFANIGVSEAYLSTIGVNVCVANELDPTRAETYRKIYPSVRMICGDITKRTTMESIIAESKRQKIDVVMATPPCQGLSRASGIPKTNDRRNGLIYPVLDIIQQLKPRYVFIENVKRFLEVEIQHKGKSALITETLKARFDKSYHIETKVINTKNFGVPQSRIRAIILMSRKDAKRLWHFPNEERKEVTLRDSIGDLPSLDPYLTDATEAYRNRLFPNFQDKARRGRKASFWHSPPTHVARQVLAMRYTPTGTTAFNNKTFFPKTASGERVRGYLSTYRRLRWDAPASTVTMDNRKISSQNNVHPGRPIGTDPSGETIFSDPRALTICELMRVMSLPMDWPIPHDISEAFLRSVIGEGIPPLFVQKVFKQIA
jgi:DNA (cytosine-5)-methyltransferase 1